MKCNIFFVVDDVILMRYKIIGENEFKRTENE